MALFEPAIARNLPKSRNLLDRSALNVFALHMGAFPARTINAHQPRPPARRETDR